MISALDIAYPIVVIEDLPHEFLIMDIVRKRNGFITFSRVPTIGNFQHGKVFDSAGQIFRYEGECGWPRFRGVVKIILEAIILPTILTKLLESFVYFGPDLRSVEQVPLDDFRRLLVQAVSSFEKSRKSLTELEELLKRKKTYRDVIEGVDWWRYHGGRRDPDGHPEDDNS